MGKEWRSSLAGFLGEFWVQIEMHLAVSLLSKGDAQEVRLVEVWKSVKVIPFYHEKFSTFEHSGDAE